MHSKEISNIQKFILNTHPRGSDINWGSYDSKVPFAFYIQQNLAKLNDSHTQIVLDSVKGVKLLPLRFRFVGKKLYINASNDTSLVGKEVVSINSYPVSVILKKFEPVISREHKNRLYVSVPIFLPYDLFFRVVIGGDLGITISDIEETKNFKFNNLTVFTSKDKFAVRKLKVNLSVNYGRRYVYLYYSSCKEDFKGQFSSLVKKLRIREKIIIDLRDNGGGNSLIIKPLYGVLKNYEKVIVLISKKTFSSALMNAYELKYFYGAVLVGDESSQTISHFGEVKTYIEKTTGLAVNCSSKYFDYGSKGILKPDFYAQEGPEYLMRDVDTVLDFAVNI